MTATFWLAKTTPFWMQRAREAKQGILTLGEEVNIYGTLTDFEALGKRILEGVEKLRERDQVVSRRVGRA